MPPLLQLQKLPGKGDGELEKSVFASLFGWPEDHEFMQKMHFGASYSTSNKLPDTFWLWASKMSLKLAV